MIKFLLNHSLKVEQDLDPNMTVLQYLRSKHRKTGTKEVCASGDCGACTVVLGELDGDRIRYRSINSCITLVASLHGKQLISIEDLADKDELHPAQQALLDTHASQCGFCTPGVAMSLFAMGKEQKRCGGVTEIDPADINAGMAGNLCRCTGYRPIVDAAKAALAQPINDQFDEKEAEAVAALKDIQQNNAATELEGNGRKCLVPTDLNTLAKFFEANPKAVLYAGATDLGLEVTQKYEEIPLLINLTRVPELTAVTETDSAIEIGASTPLCDFLPLLAKEYEDFGDVMERFAATQIRNQATLGGNIANASPVADMPPLLMAVGAQIVLRKGAATRQMPLEDFFLGFHHTDLQDGELIERVIVPRRAAGVEFAAYKVSKRMEDDLSAVCAALHITLDGDTITAARVAIGGIDAYPHRATAVEAALTGQKWNETAVQLAMAAVDQDFPPEAKPRVSVRATHSYRVQVAKNLIRKFHIETTQPQALTRVTQGAH